MKIRTQWTRPAVPVKRVCVGDRGAGGAAHPLQHFYVIYINNDNKLCFFYAACIFHFFLSFFVKIFSLQITTFNSPNGIYASGKGSTKLAYTSDQSSI